MLTRIKTDNITNLQVLKVDLGNNVIDVSKLDTPSIGSPGDVLTTDGMGNLLFAPVGGTPISLSSLTDVSTLGAVFGDVLRYDGAGNWVPSSTLGSGLFLNSIEDVTITSPMQAQYLRYDGSEWVNTRIYASDILNLGLVAITNQIGSLSDVNLSSGLAPGKVLKWSGTTWYPGSPADVGGLDDLDDVDTSTTTPGNGDALVFNGISGKWEPLDIGISPASSNTFVVNTIPERDALSPAVGDQVYVQVGTEGDWELWLWDGAAYSLVSSGAEGAALTGAVSTIDGIIDFTSASVQAIGTIPANATVLSVTLRVVTASDVATIVTIGDTTNGATSYMAAVENDPQQANTTFVADTYLLNGPSNETANATITNAGTVGSGTVVITFRYE
jgi:hypothetical protein